MAFPVTLTKLSPADSDDPSQGALKIRTDIANQEDLFGIPDATPIAAALTTCTTSGLIVVHLKDSAANPSVTGDLQRNGTLLRYFDGTTVLRVISWASGTVTLFRQATAPTGWTRVTDATHTDSVIRVLLNGEVLADGGSWTITGLTADSHTHTVGVHTHTFTSSAMAGHSHSLAQTASTQNPTGANVTFDGSGNLIVANVGGGNPLLSYQTTSVSAGQASGTTDGQTPFATSAASANGVTHTPGWRPLHVDVIAASLS